MSVSEIDRLLAGLEANQSMAQREIFEAYYGRIVQLVKGNVRGRLGRRLDASDVAMSAFRSFFRHAEQGNFDCESRPQLWRLLATIAMNKLRNRVRFHQAERRSIANEADVDAPHVALDEPNAEDLAIINDEIAQVLSQMKPYHREIAERLLAGQTNTLIATETQRSTRTVRRVGHSLEQALMDRLSLSSKAT